MSLTRIVSGGQTGVDRAALDVAHDCRLAAGGWCPHGRKAEDGSIPSRYPLQETDSPKYAVRTRQNVRDSDGTLVITIGEPVSGTALTITCAEQLQKPVLVVDLDMHPDPQPVRDWIALHNIATLNIAGPRESTSPGIGDRTATFLKQVIKLVSNVTV